MVACSSVLCGLQHSYPSNGKPPAHVQLQSSPYSLWTRESQLYGIIRVTREISPNDCALRSIAMASTAFHTYVFQSCVAWTSLRSLIKQMVLLDSHDEPSLEGTSHSPTLSLQRYLGIGLPRSWNELEVRSLLYMADACGLERPCQVRAYIDMYLPLECSSMVPYCELRLID